MVAIPKRKGTKVKINKIKYGGKPRTYLGMSGIGEECLRKQFLRFHWALIEKHSATKERIFNIGHLYEQLIIQELKNAGIEVYKQFEEDGERIELFGTPDEEQEELIGFAGHEMGHPDGRCLGVIEAKKTPHLLELKTMQRKYFIQLIKKGIKAYHPIYYGQCQRYMREMKLERCLFIVVNKDDGDLHVERIDHDKNFSADLVRRGQEIIMSSSIPLRGYPEGFFKCDKGYCEVKGICEGTEKPTKNCRTCEYSDLENDGVWSCSNSKAIEKVSDGKCDNDEMELPVKLQRKGCKFYKLGWGIETPVFIE